MRILSIITPLFLWLMASSTTLAQTPVLQTPTATPEPSGMCESAVIISHVRGAGTVVTTIDGEEVTDSPLEFTTGQTICFTAQAEPIIDEYGRQINRFFNHAIRVGDGNLSFFSNPATCLTPRIPAVEQCQVENTTTFMTIFIPEPVTPEPVAPVPSASPSTPIPIATSSPTPTPLPTIVGVRCGPPVIDSEYRNVLGWEPRNRESFTPGENIIFRSNRSVESCTPPQHWIVNGEPIELPPLATRDPAYPAPSDPAYPAPERVGAAHVAADCESSPYPCLRATMPASCQLEVGATFNTCPFGADGQSEPTANEIIAEPTSPSPSEQSVAEPTDPQSIPEPITIVLFGLGTAGLAGYAQLRRRTQ